MKTILIDEKVANAIIHNDEHMFQKGNMPETIKSMKFITMTGREMSIQQFFDYYKDSILVIAGYLKIAVEKNSKSKIKAILIDEKIANTIIHKEEHLRLGFMPEEIKSIKFISTTGGEMSIQSFFDYYKNALHILAEYLKLAYAEETI